MTMTKHTPGPWMPVQKANGAFCRHPAIISDKGQVANATWADSETTTDANARLIAAAPELLSQLEFAVALLKPMFGHTAQVERMENAIAKATGGTTCR